MMSRLWEAGAEAGLAWREARFKGKPRFREALASQGSRQA